MITWDNYLDNYSMCWSIILRKIVHDCIGCLGTGVSRAKSRVFVPGPSVCSDIISPLSSAVQTLGPTLPASPSEGTCLPE